MTIKIIDCDQLFWSLNDYVVRTIPRKSQGNKGGVRIMECADKKGYNGLCFINLKTLKIESYIDKEEMGDINFKA